jgi:DNA-binding transcriptional MocR family regulator
VSVSVQDSISGDGANAIAASIEAGVDAGTLAPGAALPSVRGLATHLGVSPTTVAAAYRSLRRRGVIVTHDRSRTVIAHRPPAPTLATPPVPAGAVDLASGNPDPALLPDLPAALRRLDVPLRLYGDADAVPELVDRVRAWLDADGVPSDHLAVVSGALDGIERVLSLHLRPGDRVAVEDPVYAGVLDIVRALGLVPVPVTIDVDGPQPAGLDHALRSGVAAVVVTPRAQNPSSAAITPDRAVRLRDVLAAHPHVLVVEDDHASVIAGPDAVTLTTDRERFAVVRSFAKALGPDLRLAVLSGDQRTVMRVRGRQHVGHGWVSHVLQRLTLELWRTAAADGTLDRARSTYAARREAVVTALGDRGVTAWGRSGLCVWVPVRVEGPTLQALLAAGWVAQAGELYRLASPPALRLAIGALPVERAPALADAVAGALTARDGTRLA